MKIGLVLPGGGARGSFQLGVYLALKKYHLTEQITCMSGGSIGAFSMMSFLMNDELRAYKTFKDMNSETVLGYKRRIAQKVPIRGQGVFSRDPLVKYLNENFDLSKLVETDIPLYFSLAKQVRKTLLRTEYEAEYVNVNHLSHYSMVNLLLATSAIPRVFDEVEIAGNTYVDCLKADNEPFKPLLKHDIDVLIVIPLTASHDPRRYFGLDIPVIDFETKALRDAPMITMLGFEPQKVDDYLNYGYFAGLAILSTLKREGKLESSKTLPPYSSLITQGIEIYPTRKYSIDAILKDARKAPK